MCATLCTAQVFHFVRHLKGLHHVFTLLEQADAFSRSSQLTANRRPRTQAAVGSSSPNRAPYNANTQQIDKNVASANGTVSERCTSSAPTPAPKNISRTDTSRLCQRGLVPPASAESAASPVIVSVSTVVVKSGTPIFRTVAFLTPIAKAVKVDLHSNSRKYLKPRFTWRLPQYKVGCDSESVDSVVRRCLFRRNRWPVLYPWSATGRLRCASRSAAKALLSKNS